jgi:two-component system, cell cycle response regulator CtrA
MRVLLIEDDSATAQSIELMLQSEGFNCYTTDLGEEGVDLGKLYDYDIILLDLNLPDMSGYEVLKTLRVSKVQTPILILSGLVQIEDKVRGLGFGADDYMTKPFHKDELVAFTPSCGGRKVILSRLLKLANCASISTPRRLRFMASAFT